MFKHAIHILRGTLGHESSAVSGYGNDTGLNGGAGTIAFEIA